MRTVDLWIDFMIGSHCGFYHKPNRKPKLKKGKNTQISLHITTKTFTHKHMKHKCSQQKECQLTPFSSLI